MRTTEERREDCIFVIMQQLYGNRTGMELKRADVKYIIRGHLDHSLANDLDTVELKMVKVPGADQIVIVYDQTQEEEYVNVRLPEIYAEADDYRERWGRELVVPPSCEIAEIGFKIYTRCFACRMDEKGLLQSLEEGDAEKFINFLTM